MKSDRPFEFLGFQSLKGNAGKFRLYFSVSGAIVMIKDRSLFKHGPRALWDVAPAEWWELKFGNRDGVYWDMANSWIIHESFRAGIYVSPDDGKRKILTGRNTQK